VDAWLDRLFLSEVSLLDVRLAPCVPAAGRPPSHREALRRVGGSLSRAAGTLVVAPARSFIGRSYLAIASPRLNFFGRGVVLCFAGQ
jgi:hypothetical protein